jgi:hypothetical protein
MDINIALACCEIGLNLLYNADINKARFYYWVAEGYLNGPSVVTNIASWEHAKQYIRERMLTHMCRYAREFALNTNSEIGSFSSVILASLVKQNAALKIWNDKFKEIEKASKEMGCLPQDVMNTSTQEIYYAENVWSAEIDETFLSLIVPYVQRQVLYEKLSPLETSARQLTVLICVEGLRIQRYNMAPIRPFEDMVNLANFIADLTLAPPFIFLPMFVCDAIGFAARVHLQVMATAFNSDTLQKLKLDYAALQKLSRRFQFVHSRSQNLMNEIDQCIKYAAEQQHVISQSQPAHPLSTPEPVQPTNFVNSGISDDFIDAWERIFNDVVEENLRSEDQLLFLL